MKTTRPVLTSSRILSSSPLISPRLILRPVTQSDLTAFHTLRTDAQVMINTTSGLPDADLAATQKWLDRFLPPNDAKTACFAICSRPSSSSTGSEAGEGPLVGSIGLASPEPPEVGYTIRHEDWGKGYGTEALMAFLSWYWDLDRRDVEVDDDLPELRLRPDQEEEPVVRERITAMIEVENIGSRRVAEKCGFKLVAGKEWKPEPDHRGPATLVWYYLERPVVGI